MKRYGGLFYLAALLSLFIVRYFLASQSIPPQGLGEYVVQLDHKEELLTKKGLKYRLGFRLEEPAGVRLLAHSQDSIWQNAWPGQVMMIQGQWKALPEAHSLQRFDYGQYLFRQGYKGILDIQNGAMASADSNPNPPLREQLLRTIDTWTWKESNRAIFKALILGYKGELSTDLKSDFSKAGAMHFLAVSGLHVGILYLLLGFLAQLTGLAHKPWLELLFILGAMWTYAFLCGAAPSVLRAVTMFSFLALGRISYRPLGSLRALLYSALLWLWIDPLLIHAVGFQLSYLAVLGILVFLPKLEAWYRPASPFWFRIVQVFYLSIAAQAFTWPLSIYYFGQFPCYFWLSSFILMPLIAIIMYGGLLCLLSAPREALQTWILQFYEYLLDGLQFVVGFIQQLPGSSIQFENFPLALMLFLLAVSIGFLLHRTWRLPYFSALVIAFGLYRLSFRIIEPRIELLDHGPYPYLKELRIAERRYFFHALSTEELNQKLKYWDRIESTDLLLPMNQPYIDSLIHWNQSLDLATKKAP